jgi:hypothetical protein
MGNLGDQPDAGQSQHEDGNSQGLRQMELSTVRCVGSGHHKVAGNVSGENMPQGQEAGEVDHSRNDTEQWWQVGLQPRQLLSAIRRMGPVWKRDGTSSQP